MTRAHDNRQKTLSTKKLSHLLLDRIIENSPVNMWVSDHNGVLIHANRALCNHLKLTEADIVGKYNILKDQQVINQGFLPLVTDVFEKGVSARFTIDYDTSLSALQLVQSTVTTLEVTISPVINEEGEVVNAIIQHLDITEHKLRAETFKKAKETAEMANYLKSEFISRMSHELRTPMCAIRLSIELLKTSPLSAEQQTQLDSILDCSNDLLALINDILDLSKIETGKLPLAHQEFNLREMIESTVNMQRAQAVHKGLRIRSYIGAEIPPVVTGDKLRFKQILINLLCNAIKFTPRGYIIVSAEVTEYTAALCYITVSVLDTGIGLTPDKLNSLFGPFQRTKEGSPEKTYGHIGLGLSICSGITRAMGGALWAESIEGVGSTFFLRIPFATSHLKGAAVKDKVIAPSWSGPRLRILLVEDTKTILKTLTAMLTKLGFIVFTAQNGRDALEAWTFQHFDAILMDIQMPIMDGAAVTEIIRTTEQETGTHIPIIALTAHALKEDREYLLTHGFDGCVTKPVTVASLLVELTACVTTPHTTEI